MRIYFVVLVFSTTPYTPFAPAWVWNGNYQPEKQHSEWAPNLFSKFREISTCSRSMSTTVDFWIQCFDIRLSFLSIFTSNRAYPREKCQRLFRETAQCVNPKSFREIVPKKWLGRNEVSRRPSNHWGFEVKVAEEWDIFAKICQIQNSRENFEEKLFYFIFFTRF